MAERNLEGVESLLGFKPSSDILQSRFRGQDIDGVDRGIDDAIIGVYQRTEITSYDQFLKELSAEIPIKVPNEVAQVVINALKDPDSVIAKKGQKAVVALYAGSIVSGVRQFVTGTADIDDDIYSSAIEKVISVLSKSESQVSVAQRVYIEAKRGAEAWVEDTGRHLDELTLDEAEKQGNFNVVDGFRTAVLGDLKSILNSRLQRLSSRERKTVIDIFGLAEDPEQSLAQVGQKLNVTRERVRQIEQRALRKLRYPSNSRHLADFEAGERVSGWQKREREVRVLRIPSEGSRAPVTLTSRELADYDWRNWASQFTLRSGYLYEELYRYAKYLRSKDPSFDMREYEQVRDENKGEGSSNRGHEWREHPDAVRWANWVEEHPLSLGASVRAEMDRYSSFKKYWDRIDAEA